MKRTRKYIGIVVVILVLIVAALYQNGHIGISKGRIERDARSSPRIAEDWQSSKDAGKDVAAVILYSPDLSDYSYSIYVNRPGFSFGYIFRLGGSGVEIDEGVQEIQIEGFNERAFVSMNKQQISLIEIDDGSTIQKIEIDSEKPFALVLPTNAESITMYDINGNPVEYISRHI